jgi:membrane protease YdiL (CAAX protease family)
MDRVLSESRRWLAWMPVTVLVAAALVGPLRLPALVLVAAVSMFVLARAGREAPAGSSVAWVAALPVAVLLALGLLPDPPVANPGACEDLASSPVVRRLLQAGAVLGTVALLAPRLGGRRSLGLVMPPDRRVTALALATPIIVPLGIVLGPPLAEPFFGEIVIGLPSPAALLPALLLAVANATLEEVGYRGALQRWGAPALGRSGAIVAQALVFGSAHIGADLLAGGPVLWLGLVGAGVIAGVVADRTRSLLLPIVAHVAFDVPLALALTCRLA